MNFSGKQFPKEVIIMAVRWYLAYPLSYRNVEELIQEWNITLDRSSVQRWVDEFGSYLMSKVRKYLKRNFKRSWHLDETYIKDKKLGRKQPSFRNNSGILLCNDGISLQRAIHHGGKPPRFSLCC